MKFKMQNIRNKKLKRCLYIILFEIIRQNLNHLKMNHDNLKFRIKHLQNTLCIIFRLADVEKIIIVSYFFLSIIYSFKCDIKVMFKCS